MWGFVSLAVSGFWGIAITNGVTILKCLLVTRKNVVLFAKFAKNRRVLEIKRSFDFYQLGGCGERHFPDTKHLFDPFSEVAQVL